MTTGADNSQNSTFLLRILNSPFSKFAIQKADWKPLDSSRDAVDTSRKKKNAQDTVRQMQLAILISQTRLYLQEEMKSGTDVETSV